MQNIAICCQIIYNGNMRIILASASPRRHQLLHKIVDQFEIIVSNSDEQCSATTAQQLVVELACQKAQEVFGNNTDALVIGCDTIVECDGVIYGKPTSNSHAHDMISTLSGRSHNVWTGVCVMDSNRTVQLAQCTKVTFYNVTSSDISLYVAHNNCLDKAGGYGIQDGVLVSNIEGSYDNVMGLPTEALGTVLAQWQHTGEK